MRYRFQRHSWQLAYYSHLEADAEVLVSNLLPEKALLGKESRAVHGAKPTLLGLLTYRLHTGALSKQCSEGKVVI